MNSKPLVANGFEDAFLGYTEIRKTGEILSVYSTEKCLEILVKQKMTEEEALEYFEFNVLGAYVQGAPLFLTETSLEDFHEMYWADEPKKLKKK